MNYIKRLEQEKAVLKAELKAVTTGFHDLFGYLESPKFYIDTTVQVQDVMNRLQAIRDASIQAGNETENAFYRQGEDNDKAD